MRTCRFRDEWIAPAEPERVWSLRVRYRGNAAGERRVEHLTATAGRKPRERSGQRIGRWIGGEKVVAVSGGRGALIR